jgi:hypothetical protein
MSTYRTIPRVAAGTGHWREVMEIVQKARQRKTERRHFLHQAPDAELRAKTRTLLCSLHASVSFASTLRFTS